MEPLVSTHTLLNIIRTASPSSPFVRNGMVILVLCAIAAVIRRSFGDPSEAVFAGAMMIAGVVLLMIVSFTAKKAPNAVLRHCAFGITILLTILFCLSCVLLFTKYFFEWPATPRLVRSQTTETLKVLDDSIRDRLKKIERAKAEAIGAMDSFLGELPSIPWDEMPSRLQVVTNRLERSRDDMILLIAGTLYRSTIDEAVIVQPNPLAPVSQPDLLTNNLHALVENRWTIASPNMPKEASLAALSSNLLILKTASEAAPTFHTHARAGRGVLKGTAEYETSIKGSMHDSLTYTKKLLQDSWQAVIESELIRNIVSAPPQ